MVFPQMGMNPMAQGMSQGMQMSPLAAAGMPQTAASFGVQSPVFPGGMGTSAATAQNMGQQQGNGVMSGDTMSLFMGLQGMMMGLMGMVMTLLMGILSGGISGQAPAGNQQGSLASAMGGNDGGNTSSAINTSTSEGSKKSDNKMDNGGGGVPAGDSTPEMQRLAATARKAGGAMNKPGWCLGGVQATLRAYGGPTIPPQGSAYKAAGYMAGHPDQFEEVSGVSKDELKKLGPGYIVVYERGGTGDLAEHGHIFVTLGGGKEASSTIRDIFTPPNGFRVFKLKK